MLYTKILIFIYLFIYLFETQTVVVDVVLLKIVTWSKCMSIFILFGRMHSVTNQLRCSDTDSDDSENLDSGNEYYFDLRVNGAMQRWIPLFLSCLFSIQ